MLVFMLCVAAISGDSVLVNHEKGKALNDKQLVTAVEKAVKDGVLVDDAERIVGVRATINTKRKGDWKTLKITDFGTDESVPKFNEMENVVYWDRPLKSDSPCVASSVVGITWSKKGEARIFFANVYFP